MAESMAAVSPPAGRSWPHPVIIAPKPPKTSHITPVFLIRRLYSCMLPSLHQK
jgi:hypothetical protein